MLKREQAKNPGNALKSVAWLGGAHTATGNNLLYGWALLDKSYRCHNPIGLHIPRHYFISSKACHFLDPIMAVSSSCTVLVTPHEGSGEEIIINNLKICLKIEQKIFANKNEDG